MKTPLIVLLGLSALAHLSSAQILSPGSSTTANHEKQIIGYVTQWDAWKAASYGIEKQGMFNQLNLDYRKYTILNFSFFGVAVDGTLHSADLINKNIYKPTEVQSPGQMLMTDVSSSWDYWILYGEITPAWDVTPALAAQGYAVAAPGWKNDSLGIAPTAFPIPVPNPNGPKGLLQLCQDNGVKCMASIGGWSMSKHFKEVAADPVKRARLIADLQKVIAMGFDGIDIDWEYPGPFWGMNFQGAEVDFTNFALLMEELRAAIGPDKLITAAFAAQPNKLAGFDWPRISAVMDYFNIMSYDYHGGWNDTAGHNSALYPWPGQEGGDQSWHTTVSGLAAMGAPLDKINMGMGFYGRGVETTGMGAVNAPTKKTERFLQPDGPANTAGDFVNWPEAEGSPFYMQILARTTGWTDSWDNHAKVPFKTRSGAFLSYDNPRSIGLKSKYVRDHGLAGVIIWTAFGDMVFGPVDSGSAKLPRASTTQTPLVDTLNSVLAGNAVPNETSPYLGIAATNGTEASRVMNFAVTLSAAAASPVTVNYATSNGTAIASQDYTAVSGTLTFAPGTTVKSVAVPILGDISKEVLESFNLVLSSPSGAPLAVSTATGTIIDSSGPARGLSTLPNRPITVGYINALRNEVGAESTLSAAQIAAEMAAVHWDGYDMIIHGFAEPKSDGTIGEALGPFKSYQSALLTEAGARNKTVLLSVGGAFPARLADQFATIAASPALRATFIQNLINYIKLHQYDGVDIDWEFPEVPTGKSNLNLLMADLYTALKAEDDDYIVMFGTGPGWYMGSYDFATLKNHCDFFFYFGYDWKNPQNGPMTKPGSGVQWTTAGDSMAEQSVRGGINYVLGKGFPADKIICGLPFYGSANTSWSAVRNQYVANKATFDAAIDANSMEVLINSEWFTTPPAMKQKMDALLRASKSVLTGSAVIRGVGTWEIGHEHRSNPDLSVAFEEWITAYTGLPAPPTVSIANASGPEGNSGTSTLNVTVSLNKAFTETVTVAYATANGTATAGQDYQATSGTLTFLAGETSKTIPVTIIGDEVEEANETFTVTLSSPVGATLGTAVATGTIQNDGDGAGSWTRHYTPSANPNLTVQFKSPTNAWSTGFSGADIVITNNGPALPAWTLEFDASFGQSGFWNAGTWQVSSGRHTITNPTWADYSLATGGNISIGFNGVGTWAMPTNVKVNGESIGGGPVGNVKLSAWLTTHSLTQANQHLDGDGDGVPSLVEFLLGRNPTSSQGSAPVLVPAIQKLNVGGNLQDYCTVTVSVDTLAEGIEYRIESSDNLAVWQAGASSAVLHTSSASGNRTTAVWRSGTPVGTGAQRFFRLVARPVTP